MFPTRCLAFVLAVAAVATSLAPLAEARRRHHDHAYSNSDGYYGQGFGSQGYAPYGYRSSGHESSAYGYSGYRQSAYGSVSAYSPYGYGHNAGYSPYGYQPRRRHRSVLPYVVGAAAAGYVLTR